SAMMSCMSRSSARGGGSCVRLRVAGIFVEEAGGAPAHEHAGGVHGGDGDDGDGGGVGDAQVGDAAHAQAGVDDGVGIVAHAAGAGVVIGGDGVLADEALD